MVGIGPLKSDQAGFVRSWGRLGRLRYHTGPAQYLASCAAAPIAPAGRCVASSSPYEQPGTPPRRQVALEPGRLGPSSVPHRPSPVPAPTDSAGLVDVLTELVADEQPGTARAAGCPRARAVLGWCGTAAGLGRGRDWHSSWDALCRRCELRRIRYHTGPVPLESGIYLPPLEKSGRAVIPA